MRATQTFRSTLNKKTLTTACLLSLLWQSAASHETQGLAKYEPPQGRVLVFIGQDNKSVGGNGPYVDGYVDKVVVPAGILVWRHA